MGQCLLVKGCSTKVSVRLRRTANGSSQGHIGLGIDGNSDIAYYNHLYSVTLLYMSAQGSSGTVSDFTVWSNALVEVTQYAPNVVTNGVYNAFVKLSWFRAPETIQTGFDWDFPSNNDKDWKWWVAFNEYWVGDMA